VILKLDTSGVYQWHTFYGSSEYDSAWEVVTDGIGGVYVVGVTGIWNGDGNSPPLHAHSGGHDIAVLKLTSDGEYVWHTFYGNSQDDDGLDLDIDNNRNIFVTGTSSGTWLGDHGSQPLHSFSGGEWDIVILKLSEQGEYQWHTFYGSSDGMYWEEAGHGITVTGDGLVSVVGHATNTWLGDGNVPPITPFNGPIDTFLLVLDSQGTYQQHRFYGAGAGGYYQHSVPAKDICTDGEGNIISTGNSAGTWLGDGDAQPLNQHSGFANYDIEVIKMVKVILNRVFLPVLIK